MISSARKRQVGEHEHGARSPKRQRSSPPQALYRPTPLMAHRSPGKKQRTHPQPHRRSEAIKQGYQKNGFWRRHFTAVKSAAGAAVGSISIFKSEKKAPAPAAAPVQQKENYRPFKGLQHGGGFLQASSHASTSNTHAYNNSAHAQPRPGATFHAKPANDYREPPTPSASSVADDDDEEVGDDTFVNRGNGLSGSLFQAPSSAMQSFPRQQQPVLVPGMTRAQRERLDVLKAEHTHAKNVAWGRGSPTVHAPAELVELQALYDAQKRAEKGKSRAIAQYPLLPQQQQLQPAAGYRKKRPMGQALPQNRQAQRLQEDSHALRAAYEQQKKAGSFGGDWAAYQQRDAYEKHVAAQEEKEESARAVALVGEALQSTSLLPSGKESRTRDVDSELETIFRNQKSAKAGIPAASPSHADKIKAKKAAQAAQAAVLLRRRRRWADRLSDADQAIVNAALKDGSFKSSISKAEVIHKDLIKLKGLDWLNDEVILFFCQLINLRSEAAEKSGDMMWNGAKLLKAYAFNTFFYVKISGTGPQNGYPNVKNWTKRAKVDIFERDVILVPINKGNSHWVCAAINFRLKRVEFYDSLGKRDPKVYQLLRQYMSDEWKDKKPGQGEFDFTGWDDYWGEDDIPRQENGSDCGVFVCTFLEAISREGTAEDGFDFSQRNMPYLRNKMVLEIKQQKLIPEPWA